MTDIVNNATIRVVADASGVEAGLRPAIDAANRTGRAITQTGERSAAAARAVEHSQRNIIASIQRTTMAMEAGGRSTASYYESMGRSRGVDPATLTPYLNQLRAVEAAQVQATQATQAQAAAARDLAQAQASKDSFLAGLREQIALFGKSTEEVLRYRAAQAGAAQESAMLILQLQNMRAAQQQAETAARALAQAQREAAQADTSRTTFLDGLREQIALFGRSTEEVTRYRAAQLGAASAAEPLIAQLRDLRLAQEQQTYATRMEAQAQRELAQIDSNRTSFIKGLEQQVAAIGKTRTEMLALQAAQLGVTNQAKPLIDQLHAQDQSFRNGGMSAAAMSAALRGVPAQMTDIIVSLQGGQAPLTVLLQQGGQLKDMFGGVGAAARALGGALLGLINPYTITAAVAGTLLLALKAGHDESLAYARALAMTGNFAGVTTGQMGDMAHQIGLVTGSQHEAAKALVELAGTGAIAGENLAEFGTVAIEAQHILGKSVSDTAAEFAKLGKSPLNALREIGEKYNFITAATYAQVKAAQEQGRAVDAANIAQKAYAEGILGQREKVLDSLTDWERGWLRIKKATSGAVDSVIDFVAGREGSNFEKINGLLAEREGIEGRIARLKRQGALNKGDNYDPAKDGDVLAAEASLAANERAINAIRGRGDAQRKAANDEAAAARATAVRNKWLDESNILLSRRQMLERDLGEARTEGQKNDLSEEEIQARLTVVRRKYNDVFVTGIDASVASLRARGELEDELSKRAIAQIEARRNAGEITEDQALRQTAGEDLARFDRRKREAQELLALAGKKINNEREQREIAGRVTLIDAQRASRQTQLENDLAAAQRKRSQDSIDLYAQGVKAAAAELTGLEDQVKAQQLANEEIGLSKEAVAALQAERMLGIATLKEETAAQFEAKEGGEVAAAIYRRQADELRKLARLKQEGAVKDGIAEANKKALDRLNEFLDPAKTQTFGEALREAFGTAGDSITKMTGALDAFGKRQAKIAEERENADLLLRNGKIDEVKYVEYVDQLNEASTKNRLAGYGAMTSAASGFFGEQSRGYRALQAASQVFHAAELAMTLAELVPKGIAAVLNQGNGDPYSAFGRMAAMAAIVAGLGVAIGGVGGGGPGLTESRQKAQGTGSVLGSNDKSESIAKSLDVMESLASKELGVSTGMLLSLRNIEAGIGQFASLLVRTTGVTGDFGSGLEKNAFDSKGVGIVGGIVGAIAGGLVGAVIGKTFIGKALSSIFGGKQTVEDTGFTMGKANYASIIGGGVSASQYADVKTDGGWFRSDKRSTQIEGIGAEGNRQISSILTSLYDTVFEAGKLLQINGDDFTARLNSFVVDIGKVSLKGKTGEEIQKELSAVFSKVGDDLASFGVAGITQFQKVGEGALETLARVASNYAGLDAVLGTLGKSFGATGIASIAARQDLLSMAGGIDKLSSQASSFAENYLSEAERLVPVQRFVTAQLAEMGLTSLQSRDAFKQHVLGLDLTIASEREQYVQLMALQEAFAKVFPEIENTTLSLADAKSALADAYNTETDAINATINRVSSFATSLKSLRDNALLGNLSPLSPQQKYAEAKAQYEAVLKAARGGDETAQSQYQGVFNAFLTASREVFASSSQYQADFAFAQGATEEAARWAELQIDVNRAQLDVLKLQVSGIIDVNKSVLSVREALVQYHEAMGRNTMPATGYAPPQAGPIPYASYGTSNTEPLIAEIKSLNTKIEAQTKVIETQTVQLALAAHNSASENADQVADAVRAAKPILTRVAPE